MRLLRRRNSPLTLRQRRGFPLLGKPDFHRQKALRMEILRTFRREPDVVFYTLYIHRAVLGCLSHAEFAGLTLSDSTDLGCWPGWWSK